MAETSHFQESTCSSNANIVVATDTQVSTKVDLMGTTLEGLVLPAGLTSTAIRFRVAINASDTPLPLFDAAGARISVTCDANARTVGLNNSLFRGWRFMQLDMGTAEVADRTIILMTKPS